MAMEKESGVLQPEHMAIVEAARDQVMAQFKNQ